MSLRISSLVWRATLPTGTLKLVAARLADFADDDGGRVFPSNARIARDCAITDRTVREAIRSLLAIGVLILVAEERPGQYRPREYRFNLDELIARDETDDPPEAPDGAEGGSSFRGGPPSGRNDVPPSQLDREEAPSPLPTEEGGTSFPPVLMEGGSSFLPVPIEGGTSFLPVSGEGGSSFRGGGKELPPDPSRDPPREKRDSPAPAAPKRTRIAPDDEPEGFADWYAAYPRKRDPGQARKAYRAALRKTSPAVLLMAARAYADDCRRTGRDPKFIKHPTTWLNAEAWTNPPELTEGGFHHGQHTHSPAQEPRGAAAVEQLLARLGKGSRDAQRRADDGPGLHRPAWDLDLSATPAPDDPPGGE